MVKYPINDEGVALLKDYEKFWKTTKAAPRLAVAYWDELGKVWTLGWGFTKGVKEGDTMTLEEANERLARELEEEYVNPILEVLTVETNENELAAFAVLAWNIGMGWKGAKKPKGAKDGFRQSSVLRAHNRGDKMAAARAFGLWNKSSGEVVAGLTRRRASESALYLKPTGDEQPLPTPQVVESETKMTKSPIAATATAAGVTSTIGVTAQLVQQLNPYAHYLKDFLPFIAIGAGAACVIMVGYVVYLRFRQRKEGWV